MSERVLQRFEDLIAWQRARNLVAIVYRVTCMPAIAKDYSFKDQVRRASVSVMTNLAEGFERIHDKEKLQFYNIARGSVGEVRSLLYVCQDQYGLSKSDFDEAYSLTIETGKLISGLMIATRKRSIPSSPTTTGL